jgi:DNA-directed RNA polymerase subunit RPC12/RpoP
MSRTVSFLVIGMAVVLLAVGLVFLCGMAGESASAFRLLVSLILLGAGGGLAFWGGTSLRRAVALNPENLGDRITQLARQSGHGEVTLSQAVSALNAPDEVVEEALRLLVERGQAYPEYRQDREVYVFPGLRTAKMIRRCESCGTEYSVKEPIYTCTRCGGKVEVIRL